MFDLGVILWREIRSLLLLEMKQPEDKLKWNHSAEFFKLWGGNCVMKKFEVFGMKGLAFQKSLCWISQTLS